MISWVPFQQINRWHLERIAESLHAAPAEIRFEADDVMKKLATGVLRLFEFDGGILLVRQDGKRLMLDGISCTKLSKVWKLVPAVRRLAADWLCDTIVTTVFDERLARAINKLGGRVEAYDLILPVEQEDERQQD